MRTILSIFFILSIVTMVAAMENRAQERSKDGKAAKLSCNKSENADVELDICLPAQDKVGAEIKCLVNLTNKKDYALRYLSASHLRDFQIEIKDSVRKVVAYTAYGSLTIAGVSNKKVLEELGPNQSLSMTYDLTRFFDLTAADRYTIRVSRRINGENISVSATFAVIDE